MGYLDLVRSESSTGEKVNRGGTVKAGNGRARRILVEAVWAYWRLALEAGQAAEGASRAAAGPGDRVESPIAAVQALSRSLERKGKQLPVIATAIARELAAFVWATGREVGQSRTR
jgi:hypothetical protein